MSADKYIYSIQPVRRGITGLWNLSGDFGVLDTISEYSNTNKDNETVYAYDTPRYRVSAKFTEYANGAVIRRDSFENLSTEPLTLYSFFSRFFLEGNRYEVYTQYNGCLHESSGGWQELVTQVTAAGLGIRSCEGATPIMALKNKYHGLITVFHLLPNCQWQITAKKRPYTAKNEAVLVEYGIENNGLHLTVSPGETIDMPAVIFYQSRNENDFDAWKLHEVYNHLYPRRQMPVMYNTWFYHFDCIDVDAILSQVDAAADLGVEMFMVDAGWFGVGGHWSDAVGDWEENLTGGFCGRLLEVSDRVRAHNMTFGLWFEPERAGINAHILSTHPEFFIDGCFFDFSNPKAREFMLGSLRHVIEHYHIGFIKFDFNASTPHDPSGCGFYRYMQGHREFVEAVRHEYPGVYITGCASGGMRMDLQQGTIFDSFWLSDNQGPYEGLTIVKNTLKRMPTALIERWNVQKYCEGFPKVKTDEWQGLMLSCNNSSFDFVLNVKDEYNLAFLTGGPLGFSGDIAAYPAEYKARYREFISRYKTERSFYLTANARILIDTEDIIAIEYSDSGFNRCILQFFTKYPYTNLLTLYPAVDADADYIYEGRRITGRELTEQGIFIEKFSYNDCREIDLKKA
ncbi:MAG: alpha-galactosidase [Lachnospiraceae bacterium]|nr:alpha-galactosidase [Lachnospiraceae bacterium]